MKPNNPAIEAGFIPPGAMYNIVQRLQNNRRRESLISGRMGAGISAAGTNEGSPARFQSFLSSLPNRALRPQV